MSASSWYPDSLNWSTASSYLEGSPRYEYSAPLFSDSSTALYAAARIVSLEARGSTILTNDRGVPIGAISRTGSSPRMTTLTGFMSSKMTQ